MVRREEKGKPDFLGSCILADGTITHCWHEVSIMPRTHYIRFLICCECGTEMKTTDRNHEPNFYGDRR